MALIKCPECGKEVSSQRKDCMHCGYTFKSVISDDPNNIYPVQDAIIKILDYHNCIDKNIVDKYEEYKAEDEIENWHMAGYVFQQAFSYLKNKITVDMLRKFSDNAEGDYDRICECFDYYKEYFDDSIYNIKTTIYYLILKDKNIDFVKIDGFDIMDDEIWELENLELLEKLTKEDFKNYTDNIDEMYDSHLRHIKNLKESIYKRELYFLIEDTFNEIKPKVSDCFGTLELCEYIDNKYELNGKFYDAAGYIHIHDIIDYMKNCVQVVADKRPYLKLPVNGKMKSLGYYTYYYKKDARIDKRFLTLNEQTELSSAKQYELKYSSHDIEQLKKDPKNEILKILEFIEKENKEQERLANKANENEDDDLDFFDYYVVYFSLDDLKEIRKMYNEENNFNLRDDEEEFKRQEYYNNDYRKDMNNLLQKLQEDKKRKSEQTSNTQENHTNNSSNGKPTCPTCGSTNVSKISDLNRAVSIKVFGLLSNSIGKTFKCNKCGYKW